MDVWNLVGVLALLGFFLGVIIYSKAIKRLEATVDRMEAATKVVADNLAASINRADHADDAIPGASADAALRTGEQ